MRTTKAIVLAGFAIAIWCVSTTGCAQPSQRVPGVRVPHTAEELVVQQRLAPEAFPVAMIAKENLARVRDAKLGAGERIASLTVLVAVDGPNPKHYPDLNEEMNRPATPPEVRRAILQVLAAADYAGLESQVIPALVQTQDDVVANALRGWLSRHRQGNLLSPLVRSWADADPSDEVRRQRYILAAEALTGRPWRDALLEAFNSPGFDARGSAWELLLRNTDRPELIERLGSVQPATPGLAAVQYYIGQLGYLPRDRQELLRAVVVFATMRAQLDRAVPVAQAWAKERGYNFHPRDVHLLGGLRGDLAARLSELCGAPASAPSSEPASEPATRPSGWAVAPAGQSAGEPAPWPVKLSAADRIRIALISDWLQRGVNGERLASLAAGRGSDPAGGLIICGENGLGTVFYPSVRPRPFVPNEDMIRASRDCVAWLVVEPRAISARQDIGPATGDPQARLRDCPALIIIRQGDDLHALYWTPGAAQCVDLARIACPK